MKRKAVNKFSLLAAALVAASGFASAALAQENSFDKLANLPFVENRPTKATAQTLRDELLFQRATQTYLWALPLINTLKRLLMADRPQSANLARAPSSL